MMFRYNPATTIRSFAMNKIFVYSIPLAIGIAFAASTHAQTGECYAEDQKPSAECKPLSRAEVKKEVEKVGAATTAVGECPNIAAAPTKGGMVRTRGEVRQEAKLAVAAGKTVDLGECPE